MNIHWKGRKRYESLVFREIEYYEIGDFECNIDGIREQTF